MITMPCLPNCGNRKHFQIIVKIKDI
ncbi:rCG32329 [Rattus norvegicus]|uniref:RCG32329 n=1 Tax=Rattus norvegicus TaxID=10116 RepID=A6JX27_RAT|nr:rCG32329 [Rattus norvegicus]